MKCSKISWAASFDHPLKSTKVDNVIHDIFFPALIHRKMQARHSICRGLQAAFGASFASIATSSPMEVSTMTSVES